MTVLTPSRLRLPRLVEGLLVLAILASIGWLTPGTAGADAPAVVVKVHQRSGIVSTYFQLAARPGRTVAAGSLQLVNPTAQTVKLRLDPVNGLTASTLGSTYGMAGGHEQASTRWLRLGARRLTIAAHRAATVPVTVSVAGSATPGEYLSGVAVEALGQADATRASHGLTIGQVTRYAVGVEVTVPGPERPLLRLTGARLQREPSGLVFLLLAHNPGNVILKDVHGSALVTRAGRRVASMQIPPGTFVSGTSIAYPVPARLQHPAEGAIYHVRATLHYGTGVARLDVPVRFGHAAAVTQGRYGGRPGASGHGGGLGWVWAVLAAVAVALVVVVAVALSLRRRRRGVLVELGRVLPLLERELAAADEGRRPLGAVHVETGVISRASRQRIAAALRRRTLRPSDLVCDLGGAGLLIVLPDTGPQMTEGLAAEIETVLARQPEQAERADQADIERRGTCRAIDPAAVRVLVESAHGNDGERTHDDGRADAPHAAHP